MALTRPAPSARSYLLALPDRPMKTGATPTRLRPGVCRRAWPAQAAGAVARVVQLGHELAAAMCAPGVRVGMSMSAWERSVLLVAFSQGRELLRSKVASCAGSCRRRFSA